MRVKLIFCGIVVLACCGLMEGLCSLAAWMQFGSLDVERLNAIDSGNEYVAAIPEGYARTLTPHPYVAQNYRQTFERGNNVGQMGIDFPLVKDPAYFTILMVGGSVCEHLAASGHIERAVKEIDGKPVRVLCGAGGGWHQPQQTIMLALYGEVCDAVISLDGFNERHTFRGNVANRLEAQAGQYASLNPLMDGGYDRLATSWECNSLRQFSQRHNSRTLFYVTRAIRKRIEPPPESHPEDARSIWRLPQEWTTQQRIDFNLAQYKKYFALSDAMAERLGLKVAHFIQPCPAIGKTLTEQERRAVGELDYAQTYVAVTGQLPAIPLLDCFDEVPETVYIDAIHNNDMGQRIMAERIASEIARLWNLDQKQQHDAHR